MTRPAPIKLLDAASTVAGEAKISGTLNAAAVTVAKNFFFKLIQNTSAKNFVKYSKKLYASQKFFLRLESLKLFW